MTSFEKANRVADVKARNPISAVIGEIVPLKRKGRELVGCCPFHDDSTPSLYVNDDKGAYYCFGCEAAGDVITFVMAREHLSFSEALDRLEAGYYPSWPGSPPPPPPQRSDNVALAKKIWDAAGPIEGTPAELYLASRSLRLENLPNLPNLRFARLRYDGSGELHPALVAAVQTVDGEFAGIQRTFLTETGEKLNPREAKRSLGNIKGNAIWLQDDEDPDTRLIYICEGLEDGLSLLRMNGSSVMVAAGAGMMRWMDLPKDCKIAVIGADNDEAGQIAANEAAKTFRMRGIEAYSSSPLAHFKDWNEHLQFWEKQLPPEDPDLMWRWG